MQAKRLGKLLTAMLALAPAASAQARSETHALNRVQAVKIETTPVGRVVDIACERDPVFTVFRLGDPVRIVIDVARGDVSKLDAPIEVDDGVLGDIALAQFSDDRNALGRLIIGLEKSFDYEVKQQGTHVRVLVRGDGGPAPALLAKAPIVAPAPPFVAATKTNGVKVEGTKLAATPPEKTAEKPVEKPTAKPIEIAANVEKNVHDIQAAPLDKTLERVQVKKSKGASEVLVHIKGEKPTYEILELEDPPRVVFDFAGVSTKLPKTSHWSLGAIGKMRLGIHNDKVRLVLDGSGALPKYDVNVQDGVVRIVTAVAPKEAPVPSPALEGPVPMAPKAAERASSTLVQTLDVKRVDDRARVRLSVPESATYEVDRSLERAPSLAINGVSLAKEMEKSSDVSQMGTGLIRLTSFNERKGKGGVRLIANLSSSLSDRVYRDGADLVWEFEQREKAQQNGLVAMAPKPVELPPAPLPKVSMQPAADVAGFASQATSLVRSTSTGASARHISLDVRGADLLNVLRYISEVSGENIIAGDDVSGKITLRLRNVTWEQALDAALQTKGYGRVRQGGIIRVAPLKKLQEEKEQELARKKADEQVAPTSVRLIPINYAQAKDINEQIKPLLTKDRGKANVDERTNTIVAEDLADVLNKIENLARRLDTQTPQVLIESRIVEANTQHVRDIGIQWGGSNLFSAATGNATGLAFPNLLGFAGGSDDANTDTTGRSGTASPSRYAVNLPSPVGQGAGGSVGFVFGNAANTALLSLRLSALENNGSVRIVSSPKVTTLDNVRARISQGVSIPISVTSAAGVNTRFIDAFLELEVRPHVTQDGSIMMEIKATKNEPDFSRTGAQGDPTIQKKQAETQVLVKDGDTTVIGGIYTRNTTTTYNEVPFLSKIPVLGWLFKRKRDEDNRAELLVFITPRIVNRQQSSVIAGGGL